MYWSKECDDQMDSEGTVQELEGRSIYVRARRVKFAIDNRAR